MLKLKRDDLLKVLKENEEDREKFFFLKDNLIFNQHQETSKPKCQFCDQIGHYFD